VSSVKIGILQYFLGFFLKVGFLHKNKDTSAILLKTALVRVSSIQNTQIRGETTAKVFGKVDTFWTYQKLRWLNHRWSLLRSKQLPLLQSVRKGEQRWLLLLRFIGPLLLLTM
jgi:hypothetical protein